MHNHNQLIVRQSIQAQRHIILIILGAPEHTISTTSKLDLSRHSRAYWLNTKYSSSTQQTQLQTLIKYSTNLSITRIILPLCCGIEQNFKVVSLSLLLVQSSHKVRLYHSPYWNIHDGKFSA